MYRLDLEIPWAPTSLNKELRRNRYAKNRTNSAWDIAIHGLTIGKKPAAPLVGARLRIVRHAHRMLDFDGLVGSLKPVVDALVTAGILADDSWSVLGKWEADQQFRPKKLGQLLQVSIEEVETHT